MSKKVTEFQIEITLEIFDQEDQFSYFWKAKTFSCFAGLNLCKAMLTL